MKIRKIDSLKIIYDEECFIINNAHKIKSLNKMINILNKIITPLEEKQKNFYVRQWIFYNFLYKIKIKKNNYIFYYSKKCNIFLYFIYSLFSSFTILKNYIKKKNVERKIKKKEKEYKKYIIEHKNNVLKAYENLKENSYIYQTYGEDILSELYKRALTHDNSKNQKEEFDAYRRYFYPISQEEKEKSIKDFDKAWEHHWKNNSHHWEYRQNKKSFDKKNKEEILDILENILDWMAMSYKFNNTPYEYYEKNKDKILLCKEEKEYLEKLLIILDKELYNGR